MNRNPQLEHSPGWTLGPWTGQMDWPRSEVQDPCFDVCFITTLPGAFGALTTVNSTPFPGNGIYIVRATLAHVSAGAASAKAFRVSLLRMAGAGTELIGILGVSEGGNDSRFECVVRVGVGAFVSLENLTAYNVGESIHASIHLKRISR